MRLIDADALKEKAVHYSETEYHFEHDAVEIDDIDDAPTVEPASPWHRVEDDPPDKNKDAIFYFEWNGIQRNISGISGIVSLGELIALGCRPIAWMETPEPPKEKGE